MAYAAGPVVSEYRLSLAKLDSDISAVERRLKAIKPPQLASISVETSGQRQAADLAKLNAQLAVQQARAQAQVDKAVANSAVSQERLARAQTQTAISAQRLTSAEQQAAQQLARTARESANAAAAQSRAELQALRLANAQQRAAAGGSTWVQNIVGTNQRLSGLADTATTAIGAVGALGGAFAAVAAVSGAIDFARTGASIDAARKSFDSLAASAGTSGNALLASLQSAAAGTVANTDLIKSSNTALLLLGGDVATKLPQLLAVAKASATSLGTDVGQVFDSLVTGISRGSTELIDNAGITIKSGEAYATYAAQLGKSADALSANERQQAILNAVLVSGQQIIASTAGAGETAAASFQRAEASLSNLTATAQVAAANIGAPLAGAFATAAQGADQLLQRLTGQGNQFTQNAATVAATAPSYEAYRAQIDGTNAAIDAQILRQQGLLNLLNSVSPGLGGAAAGLLQYTAQTDALTRSQYLYMQALMAQGEAQDVAIAKAEQQGQALAVLETVFQTSGGALDEYQTRLAAVAASSEGGLQAVNSLVTQFSAGQITAEQLAATLAGLEQSTLAGAAAAQAHADARAAEASATQGSTDASLAAAAASNGAALAQLEQAAAAEQTAIQHNALDQAIRQAAAAGGDAEAAASAIAARFTGVEAPAVINLINLHRQLAAARATGQSAPGYGGTAPRDLAVAQRATQQSSARLRLEQEITRATGTTAERLDLVNRQLSRAPALSEQAIALEVEKARLLKQQADEAARSTGGAGGAKSPGVKAAERDAKELAKLDERRRELTQDTQGKLEDLAIDHSKRLAQIARESGERQLAIQRQYAEKQLEAERGLRLGSLSSRADFYDELTKSTPEIGQQAAEGLASAYEQAFAKAQELAQNGQAQLAASFLQLRQRQLQEELAYQQALAAAREAKDQGEVDRLQRIEALRAAAREEELKQLLENGDANVKARDEGLAAEGDRTAEALAEENARYTEQTGKIVDSSAEKAAKLAADEAKIRGELAQTNTVLAEQLRLSQAQAALRGTTGAGLPQAQAAALTPPAAATPAAAPGTALAAGQGGPVLVSDPALAAQVLTLGADVARIAGTVEAQGATLAQIASATQDTARRVRVGGSGS